ncbi:hypothetical protein [Pigmentiphaga sp. NML080357]|uniref:hypothetical protein n=1 Tax=Pigmentiphaga sp. NML080357 TaxID=2008675 RepID=UPI0018E9A896|nr:hypothetical protein [Pigmentiphaga sp. NML080357]
MHALRAQPSTSLWPLVAEFCLSTFWAFAFAMSILLWALGKFVELPPHIHIETLVPPAFTGLVLAMACLLQFALSIFIDRRYESKLAGALYWVVWYPLAYWMLSLFTSLVSFPKVMLKLRRRRARWVSPDRGIKALEKS